MATLNLEPAISTRYRIERVMYRGRCGIETGSHTALQPIPRARLKVPGRWRRSPRKCMLACQLHSKESADLCRLYPRNCFLRPRGFTFALQPHRLA